MKEPRAAGPPVDPEVAGAATLDLATARTRGGGSGGGGVARPEFAPGEQAGRYRIVRELGRGGFGVVYEAEDLESGRKVALKVLASEATGGPAGDRFRREARLAAALNHPNCVAVFGAEDVLGAPAIAMELMSGGTLEDRIASGPMPAAAAVDAILDVLAGLDAAARSGILHRDVKPSNCFVSERGRVRIGDFGLSRTVEGESSVTVTGSFVGTPAYASPEQVRGRPLDHRSDLYSLGATLYALLTARPPFSAGHAGEVLARIVAEPPVPFSAQPGEVPAGLQRVVLKLLEKDPARRFASYAALRAALLPFSTEGLGAAAAPARLLAILIDRLLLLPADLAAALLLAPGLGGLASPRLRIIEAIAATLVALVYFTWFEHRFGRTPGKAAMGLRVASRSGEPAPVSALLGRSAVFVGLPFLLALLPILAGRSEVDGARLLGYLVLLLPMRRRNGFGGLHEIASGTRVWAVREADVVIVPGSGQSGSALAPVAAPAFGPYLATELCWEEGAESLWVAVDPTLDRSMWIHCHPGESTAPLAATRPGLLPWLQGGRRGGTAWDAYARPGGMSLLDWVKSRGRLEWRELRRFLEGLLRELEARQPPAAPLSLAELWIDLHGNARVLPFSISPPATARPAGDAVRLCRAVVAVGLTGRIPQGEAEPPRLPLPLHARAFVDWLFSAAAAAEPAPAIAAALASAAGRARITRWQRAIPVLAMAAIPALVLLGFTTVVLLGRFGPEWIRDLFRLDGYVARLHELDAAPPGPDVTTRRESLRKVLAALQRELSLRKERFHIEVGGDGEPGAELDLESALAEAARDYPALSAAEEEAAKLQLAELEPELMRTDLGVWSQTLDAMSAPLGVIGLFACPLALLLGASPLFRLLGIAVVNRRGERASRPRAFLRALVAWSPFLALFAAGLGKTESADWWLILPLLLLALGCGVHAVVRRDRGVADLVAGTWLVPN